VLDEYLIVGVKNMDETQVAQAEESAKTLGPDDISKMIADAVSETTKTWQSRLDKVLAEKKQTETKALTVEERMAQLESDRQRERTEWARKTARAKYNLAEEIESAVLQYGSGDPEAIERGAEMLAKTWAAKEADYKSQIETLEKQVRFGTKIPVSGKQAGAKTMELSEFQKLSAKEQSAFMSTGGVLE
jgi:phosphopantetheinyl transferase (holo-ACP synthase)